MIQQDHISTTFDVLGAMLSIYLFTIFKTAVSLFPLVLILTGLILHRLVQHKQRSDDMDDFDDTPLSNEHLWKNFIFYTVVALFGMFMVGEAIEVFPLALDPGLTGVYALIYMMAMGVGEEQLFRGFFTDWLLTSLPNPYYALFCSAGIFCLYHLAVYGMVISSLAYVFFGGLILAWTSYRTLHLSPCQAGHSLNNFGAYVQQNGLPTAGIKYAITVILKVI